MKESEIRSILERLCSELDARRARMGVAVVGTTLVLGTGCGGTVETRGPDDPDGSADAAQDSNAGDAVAEDAPFDAGPLPPYMAPDSGPPLDAADEGPTPVYMSACLPADPDTDPHA